MLMPCPFCGIAPDLEFDSQSGKYIIRCKKCKEKYIRIEVMGDTIEETQALWNTRYTNKDSALFGKELVLETVSEEEHFIPGLFGFLIFQDGEIITCDMYDHGKILIDKFKLNVNPDTFDHSSYCGENGIVRISVFKGSLAIDLPVNMTKKQKDHIFEALATYPKLKNTNKFSLFSYKSHSYLIFYSLNELLEKLEEIKV